MYQSLIALIFRFPFPGFGFGISFQKSAADSRIAAVKNCRRFSTTLNLCPRKT